MSTKMIYIVNDMGPGDGGKGTVVHSLCCRHVVHTVIKEGGAQGNHGVRSGRNEFGFSQWGCGTFEGVRTHITHQFVASPEGLLNEADYLRYHGIIGAFDLLTIDERTICATPYHGITSRIREIARGSNPRGTVGTGIGVAYREAAIHPELVIRAADLREDQRRRLSMIRDRQIEVISDLLSTNCVIDPEDKAIVSEDLDLLKDDGFLDHNVERFAEAGRSLNIVGSDYLEREVLAQDGIAVVEKSHGVLTDNWFGFQPHVSALRTLPSFTHSMLDEAGYCGERFTLGVHRAYAVRHGAGPMPTTDPNMDSGNNEENRYRGKIRIGPLDFVLLRYAVEVCGGPGAFDGLAITWFDRINGEWRFCNRYENCDPKYFTPEGRIRVFDGGLTGLADYQRGLSSLLFTCKPTISAISPVPESRKVCHGLCDHMFRYKVGIPVHLVSFGPAERDKSMKDVK